MQQENSDFWAAVNSAITDVTGNSGPLVPGGQVFGGDINESVRVRAGDTRYFVKINAADRLEMFAAEAAGLEELAASHSLRVPAPVCHGSYGGKAFLVLEHMQLTHRGNAVKLGEGLAQMHRVTRKKHGWHRDNTIGSTSQLNEPTSDWLIFWRDQRLGHQLALAARNGHTGTLQSHGQRLLETLEKLLGGHNPPPALLHGDLWSGNYAYAGNGEPVVFDPAVYYGDRETDLAMTELFGGFPPDFYAAYRASYPLDEGYTRRRALYQLYHVLNHLNLFGGGYAGQALTIIDRLLTKTS